MMNKLSATLLCMNLSLLGLASHGQDEPQSEDTIENLILKLKDESFSVRETAYRDLIASKISAKELKRYLNNAKSPEVKSRLRSILGTKFISTEWIKMRGETLPKSLEASGHEFDRGEKWKLYLVKATVKGVEYIGKYRPGQPAHFAIGDKEIILTDFKLWAGHGKWVTWEKGCDNKISMGKTKKGKILYAVRAKINNGLHPGTLIENESIARIPWGGVTHKLTEFEVLVTR